jgi:hypothetical protein
MSYQKGSFGATIMLLFGPNDILIVNFGILSSFF